METSRQFYCEKRGLLTEDNKPLEDLEIPDENNIAIMDEYAQVVALRQREDCWKALVDKLRNMHGLLMKETILKLQNAILSTEIVKTKENKQTTIHYSGLKTSI